MNTTNSIKDNSPANLIKEELIAFLNKKNALRQFKFGLKREARVGNRWSMEDGFRISNDIDFMDHICKRALAKSKVKSIILEAIVWVDTNFMFERNKKTGPIKWIDLHTEWSNSH